MQARLRHGFASWFAMAGADRRTIQEIVGYETIAMTCRYPLPSSKLAAVECFSDAATQIESPSGTSTPRRKYPSPSQCSKFCTML